MVAGSHAGSWYRGCNVVTAMLRAVSVLTVLMLAACGQHPGTGDDDAGADAGMSGLEFRFVAPSIGQPVGQVTIAELHAHLRDIRALGDAAPGDSRTSLDHTDIDLQKSSDVTTVRFDKAPPGRYSTFAFQVEAPTDLDHSWWMRGSDATAGGFEVDDSRDLAMSLPLSLDLAAGTTTVVTVSISVDHLCDGVDWTVLPRDDGSYILDGDSSQLAAVHDRFAAAFTITDVQ